MQEAAQSEAAKVKRLRSSFYLPFAHLQDPVPGLPRPPLPPSGLQGAPVSAVCPPGSCTPLALSSLQHSASKAMRFQRVLVDSPLILTSSGGNRICAESGEGKQASKGTTSRTEGLGPPPTTRSEIRAFLDGAVGSQGSDAAAAAAADSEAGTSAGAALMAPTRPGRRPCLRLPSQQLAEH